MHDKMLLLDLSLPPESGDRALCLNLEWESEILLAASIECWVAPELCDVTEPPFHIRTCGWFMHGDNAGTARKTRKAKVLRDAVEMGLIAYKRGYKKLDTSVALRMRPVRFEDYQRGAGGQRGGLLPILPALAAAAPVIAKTAGLGLLSGAAAAGGGIALNKLLA